MRGPGWLLRQGYIFRDESLQVELFGSTKPTLPYLLVLFRITTQLLLSNANFVQFILLWLQCRYVINYMFIKKMIIVVSHERKKNNLNLLSFTLTSNKT